MSKLGTRAMQDAVENMKNGGVHEIPPGSNRGPGIDEYNRFAGAPLGSPWCCSFATFRVHKAAEELGINPSWPIACYVPDVIRWAKAHGLFHDAPQVGDAFVIYFPTMGRYAHIGFVRSVSADGMSFTTAEGNSNENGSREGTALVSKRRAVSKNIKFITVQ